jgi:phosphocarrier protein
MSRKACQMSARTVSVARARGLHARPAALFSQAASEQPAAVTIETADAGPVRASSILMLLTLDVGHGEEVTLRAEGEGAEESLDALAALLGTNLDEEFQQS